MESRKLQVSVAKIAVIFFVLILPSIPSGFAVENAQRIGATTLIATAELNLSTKYAIYDNVRHEMKLNISALVSTGPFTVELLLPNELRVTDIAVSPSNSNFSLAFYNRFFNRLLISPPTAASKVSAVVMTTFEGDTVFMRNTANVPLPLAFINGAFFGSGDYTILIPKNTGQTVINISNNDMVSIHVLAKDYYSFSNPTSRVVVLYEKEDRILSAFASFGLILGSSFGATIVLARSSVISKFSGNIRRLSIRSASRTLITLYVTVAVLILTLSLVFGPSPTPKVYISATPSTAKEIAPYVMAAGYDYITAADGQSSFDVMASLGVFNAAIIADFTPGYSGEQALPGMGSLQNIYILTESVPKDFVETAQRIWEPSVKLVGSPSSITSDLSKLPKPSNLFGFSVSGSTFTTVISILGVLSFMIAFLATASLISRIIESSHTSSISTLVEAIAYSLMIFMFTQMVYMASATLTKVPLGLHAGGSYNLTAVGLLGFGGGSRPRMIAAMLGFIVGALLTREGRLKINTAVFLALLGTISFVVIDPLPGGILFHQYAMTQLTSVNTPATSASINLVKGFIGSVGDLWTSELSTSYFIQRGVPFFYLGIMALAFYPKVERFVATSLLLVSSLVASLGFVRIADQIPTKALASVPPGLVIGFMIIPLIMILSFGESILRKKIRV